MDPGPWTLPLSSAPVPFRSPSPCPLGSNLPLGSCPLAPAPWHCRHTHDCRIWVIGSTSMRGLRRSLVTLLCVACCVCIWLAAFVCCLLLIPPAPAGRGPLEVPLHNVLSRDSAQATTCRRTPTLTVVDTFASQGLSTKLSTSSLREQPNLSRTLHLLLPPTLRTLVRWRTPQMLQAMRPDSTPENFQAVFCKQRHAGCDDSVRFSRRHLM